MAPGCLRLSSDPDRLASALVQLRQASPTAPRRYLAAAAHTVTIETIKLALRVTSVTFSKVVTNKRCREDPGPLQESSGWYGTPPLSNGLTLGRADRPG